MILSQGQEHTFGQHPCQLWADPPVKGQAQIQVTQPFLWPARNEQERHIRKKKQSNTSLHELLLDVCVSLSLREWGKWEQENEQCFFLRRKGGNERAAALERWTFEGLGTGDQGARLLLRAGESLLLCLMAHQGWIKDSGVILGDSTVSMQLAPF